MMDVRINVRERECIRLCVVEDANAWNSSFPPRMRKSTARLGASGGKAARSGALSNARKREVGKTNNGASRLPQVMKITFNLT